MTRLLKRSEVCQQIGFGPTWLWKALKAGTFPEPVKVFGQVRWDSRVVEAWVREQARQQEVA